MYRKCNNWLGNKLSDGLSSMEMFWIVVFLVLTPLLVQRPDTLVGWSQYIISVFFQGVALPVLGAVSKKAGDRQEKLLKETHDTVMDELAQIKAMHQEIHGVVTEIYNENKQKKEPNK